MTRVGVQPRSRQPGVVLIMVLVVLLLLNLLAVTVIESATLQARMAGNQQSYHAALQQAQGIARAIGERLENFPAALPTGLSNCAPSDRAASCHSRTLMLPAAIVVGGGASYRVERRQPERVSLQLSRRSGQPVVLEAALYEVRVTVGGPGRSGRVDIGVGTLVPLSSGPPVTVYWRELGADVL
ncbi:MAG: PilX N-terminal domain-containing pilus assembly protein [Halioglobus sp.]|nr:PilX N-terminal domain-containing pilus assembly protein [Halioglobus sp.]